MYVLNCMWLHYEMEKPNGGVGEELPPPPS